MMSRFRLLLLVATLGILSACGATQGPEGGAGGTDTEPPEPPGPALHDTIAYVPGDGDSIRAVNPDGTDDRLLWAHGRADPQGVAVIWDLDWSPDAREIAFAGTHEYDCSLHHSDVYAVGTHGLNYRRLSGPPACADLDRFPTATVRVPVRNSTFDSVDVFLYFLGARQAKQVSLAPGGSTVVVFEEVADFGPGIVQYGMIIQAERRELAASASADVEAGGTHTTAEQSVWPPSGGWEARSPTWHSGGERVGYAYGFNTLFGQEPFPDALSLGDELLEAETMPTLVMNLAWNPVDEWGGELLYEGRTFEGNAIYWVEEGSATAGQALLSFASYEHVLGLDWLPDGSGFVFSRTEGAFGDHADLWLYSLDSQTATRILALSGEFAGELSVSPDGSEIVFERAGSLSDAGTELVDPSLWIVGVDGAGLRPLMEDAGSPAWSSGG